ncbi:MAG TPA: DUF5060 domain-containing protein [Bryobacteraceae bacterium]|nr:DUF5060 domain-containing protein [Bryobacteraceae bacterium]
MRHILALACCLTMAASALPAADVERWGAYEITLTGPSAGNPFLDVQIGAHFRYRNRVVDVDGFYDGEGVYRIRFMPDELGNWTYTTSSNVPALAGKSGAFTAAAPSPANHGPVRVRYTTHFGYEDGAPYTPIGTTCYAWIHQGDRLEEQTLETLRSAPFNKVRMCVFPKSYQYNRNEPVYYPFERGPDGVNDFTRFNPKFFQHLEKRVRDLQALGIEADLILFHPYDRWGFAAMPPEVNDRYLRYTVARLAAYRNVWWSLANEYDLVKTKTLADWDRFFRIVQESDPHQHLRSIHHSVTMYDHSKPWVTHVSIQGSDLEKAREYVSQYRKPVIYDECKYEGNIPKRWGNISAQELVRRFWVGTVSGAYVGHGETYLDPGDILWWSKGGVLRGESPRRIAFLRKIVEDAPAEGLNNLSTYYLGAGQEGRYYLFYFDVNQPAEYEFDLAKGAQYRADLIDPWEMSITPLPGTFAGKVTMKLPGKPYMAVRFQKVTTP